MKTLQSFRVILLIFIFIISIFAQTETPTQIAPMQLIEREIGLKQAHIYEFSLDANEFVRFTVAQKNVDPQLLISDQNGGRVREMYFQKIVGSTAISLIAAEKATFRLTIKSSGNSEMNGNYQLRMELPHPANESDRRRVNAEIVLNGAGWAEKKAKTRAERPTADEWQKRLNALQNLVAEWQNLGDSVFEAETFYQIGVAAAKLRNAEVLPTAFERSLALARTNKDVLGEANSLRRLAILAATRSARPMPTAWKWKVSA